MQFRLYCPIFKQTLFSSANFNGTPDIKLRNCPKSESREIKYLETDGQTDMMTLTVAFRNCFERQRLSTYSMNMLDKQPVPTRQRGIYT
jgi:hypothetical protein